MTYRKIFGLKHLSSLPSKSGTTVDVVVRKANEQLLQYWDQTENRLLEFYMKHQMHRLDKIESISIARKNDGRYYYFDEIEALKFSQQHDQWR